VARGGPAVTGWVAVTGDQGGSAGQASQGALHGTWLRSFEEERPGSPELIFRPASYPFPPARAPRPALRLHDDGSAVALGAGPDDRPTPLGDAGSWALDGDTLSLRTGGLSGQFTLETVEPDRLVVRPIEQSTDEEGSRS
jgi:hypothetical protein